MKHSFFLVMAFTILFGNVSYSQNKGNKNNSMTELGDPIRAYLNLNNISTVFKNDGISDINAGQDASGFVYPFGTGKTAVYESGLVWGVKISGDPQVRVGGSAYRSGLQGGKIISPGVAEDPNSPHVRIYRVRPDVYPGGPPVDLSVEANDEGKTEQQIRDQYELDWTEWRAEDGAPFNDIDSNGVYNPTIDIPGINNAIQTIWFIANDLDASKTHFLYGTDPIGIEYQATIWEYSGGALANLFFRKYKLINKSFETFDSMYISMWSDPDIGDSGDDFVGCDTILNIGFGYNGLPSDAIYGTTPPCVGFDLIRGPLVPGNPGEDRNRNGIDDANDFGLNEDNKRIYGFINLPMTAFYYFTNTDPFITDPPQGTSEGATQFYNFMQGKIGITGEYFINPVTGLPTRFALSGNPVIGAGWVDGTQQAPGDRRLGLSTGPIQMAPGDTQVVVIAEIAAGALNGVDRLAAVSLFKYYSQLAQEFYDSAFPTMVSEGVENDLPKTMELFQNYPNPFNPTTTIKYQIPELSFVTLKIYDVLGNEIATLVNDEKPAGSYEVEFSVGRDSTPDIASGIYFYSLKAGSFFVTKKMILLR
jgi:hypothetical protein